MLNSCIHLHSFFDPRVFSIIFEIPFRLERFLSEAGIGVDIWGIEPGYLEGDQFVPSLRDFSQSFQHAFGRFLKSKKEEDADLTLESSEDEEIYRLDFERTIFELYLKEAQSKLEVYWEGHRRVNFIGMGYQKLMEKVSGQISQSQIVTENFKFPR